VAVAACLIAAGCGGGDDESSTVSGANAQAPTVTAPNFDDKFKSGDGSGTTTSAPTTSGPAAARIERALGPFRDCLSQHGVEPTPFGSAQRQPQPRDPAEARKQIEARIACIPELPPKLRQAAERLKKQYQQRQG
jgi:hypothetical protein